MVQANCNSVASHLSSLPLHSNYHKPFPPSFFLSIDKPISVPALRAPISASLSPFSSATGSLLTSQPSGRAAGHIKMPGDHGSGRPHENARHRRARGRGRNPEDAFRPQDPSRNDRVRKIAGRKGNRIMGSTTPSKWN